MTQRYTIQLNPSNDGIANLIQLLEWVKLKPQTTWKLFHFDVILNPPLTFAEISSRHGLDLRLLSDFQSQGMDVDLSDLQEIVRSAHQVIDLYLLGFFDGENLIEKDFEELKRQAEIGIVLFDSDSVEFWSNQQELGRKFDHLFDVWNNPGE